MITLDEIAILIRRELRGGLPKSAIIDERTRLQDLGLSSLQMTEIVFTLEEEHKVEFDPAKAAEVETLGELITVGNESLAPARTNPGDGRRKA